MGRIFYFSAEISNVNFLTNRPQPPNQIWATQSTSTNSKNNESKKTPKNSKNSSKPTSKQERKRKEEEEEAARQEKEDSKKMAFIPDRATLKKGKGAENKTSWNQKIKDLYSKMAVA